MRKVALLAVLAAGAGLCARQPVRARHGMVATRESHATDVGMAVLESGGNAIDAAVAVGFALAVTLPAAGNIGGGGFLLARFADGRTAFIDFRERAPEKASRDMYLGPDGKATADSVVGYRASGVPGTVRGLELAHQKYGRKPWAELIDPAVRLASDGFPVSYGLAHSLRSPNTSERLGRFPESKRIFLRDGKFYEAGERFVQPELARTLERIRDRGAKDFYEGETARAAGRGHEGARRADHARRSEELPGHRAPAAHRRVSRVHDRHRASAELGRRGNFADAGRAGRLGLREIGFRIGRRRCTFMAETMRRYFADRSEYMGDPDFYMCR